MKYSRLIVVLLVFILSCKKEDEPQVITQPLQLSTIRVGTYPLDIQDAEKNKEAPFDQPVIISFSAPLDTQTVRQAVMLKKGADALPLEFSYLDDYKTISARPIQPLSSNSEYELTISNSIKGVQKETYPGLQIRFFTRKGALPITSLTINGQPALGTNLLENIPLDTKITLQFSDALNIQTVNSESIKIVSASGKTADIIISLQADKKTISISSLPLEHFNKHTLFLLPTIQGANGEVFAGLNRDFYTAVDPTPKFPLLSDDALLTLIQQQTFKYFWDFAHPVSGLARERDSSGDVVTTGGSGFGLMSIVVGMERNFISRTEGIERLTKIVGFLEKADRFHGAWSHWLHGSTGKVIPFSNNDDGGDLVETSFLVQGLLAVRQYLNAANPEESALASRITTLWEGVEWDWYTRAEKMYYTGTGRPG
jgi:hypothetical protein